MPVASTQVDAVKEIIGEIISENKKLHNNSNTCTNYDYQQYECGFCRRIIHSKYIYRLYGETDFTTSDTWGPYNFRRESSAVQQYTEAYTYGNGYIGTSAYLTRDNDGEWTLFQPVL